MVLGDLWLVLDTSWWLVGGCCYFLGVMFARRAPGERPAHARCATFVLSIVSLAPSLSSPWEVPK